MALTAKQRMFVAAYLGEAAGSARRAARIAGYKDPDKAAYTVKKHPEVARLIEESLQQIEREGLSDKRHRIAMLKERHRRLTEVIHQRSEDHICLRAPGGDTGLLVHSFKVVGEDTVDQFEVDTGTLKEIREIEAAIAAELGDRKQKVEHTGKDGKPIEVGIGITFEEALKALRNPDADDRGADPGV